ncbi:MAG: tetratricopeptide repeat protein [Bacteroidota bacterium]
MIHKIIISGDFEFSSPRSFKKVTEMYQHRCENYYKSDVLLVLDEFLDQENLVLKVPRLITKGNDKSWRNTVSLIQFVAQYAISGSMSLWMVETGKVLKQEHIEPKSDKVAIQSFLKGRELTEERGKETEAMESLTKAIQKFERHSRAYEKRGYVNYILNNFDDAIYDYTRSLEINPNHAQAYYGRALVHIVREEYDNAIVDLEMASKRSIPLQPIYWAARRMKSECHLAIEDFSGAARELKFFTDKVFDKENPNYKWRKKAYLDYGKALLSLKEFDKALDCFKCGLDIEKIREKDDQFNADIVFYRGMTLKEAGKDGFQKDIREAASMGSKKAEEVLETIS